MCADLLCLLTIIVIALGYSGCVGIVLTLGVNGIWAITMTVYLNGTVCRNERNKMIYSFLCNRCGKVIDDLRLVKRETWNASTMRFETVRDWLCVTCWKKIQPCAWDDMSKDFDGCNGCSHPCYTFD